MGRCDTRCKNVTRKPGDPATSPEPPEQARPGLGPPRRARAAGAREVGPDRLPERDRPDPGPARPNRAGRRPCSHEHTSCNGQAPHASRGDSARHHREPARAIARRGTGCRGAGDRGAGPTAGGHGRGARPWHDGRDGRVRRCARGSRRGQGRPAAGELAETPGAGPVAGPPRCRSRDVEKRPVALLQGLLGAPPGREVRPGRRAAGRQ